MSRADEHKNNLKVKDEELEQVKIEAERQRKELQQEMVCRGKSLVFATITVNVVNELLFAHMHSWAVTRRCSHRET